MKHRLYIVVPCYNEQEVIDESADLLSQKCEQLISQGKIDESSRIVIVNDGSADHTWELIENLYKRDQRFIGIDLSRNQGHQYAVLAGIIYAKEYADCVITIDADLQDDIDAIDAMIDKFHEGCDIVYGVRNNRTTDHFLKRSTANLFYKVMKFLGAETINNHADFRLMSQRAIVALEQYEEVNLFLRGIIPLIGFKTDKVYYSRNARTAGTTKYPLKKMLALAWEGITSTSMKPLRFISVLGFTICFFSILMLGYILIRYFTGHTTVGWASVTVSLWTIGGLLLFCMGIIGEYIGKIYMETKKRPRYFINKLLDDLNRDEVSADDRV
ncbi:MAG: glycosyltransferase [Herbinix sp.]|nr:glycosyltransferase [Herbinix sp.]